MQLLKSISGQCLNSRKPLLGSYHGEGIKFALKLLILTALLFTSTAAYSGKKDAVDVVLVMDSSGSMKKTDPQSLRIPAAKLFISLLAEGDRAGVISFSENGHPLIDLTQVNNKDDKERLFQAADQITSDGLYTNLNDALRSGMEMLSKVKQDGRNQIIVLMSDGMMDVGDPSRDMELVVNIRNELASALENQKIKVYTIAFTVQSDRKLLEKISKQTGGFYNIALADKDMHLIFTSIFESLKSPDMIPISKNGFNIDKSIEEVTVVATKGSSNTRIMLNTPEGRSYTHSNKSDNVLWFESDNFDMVTVKNPAVGKWDILFSTGENNKAYVITELKLQTNFDKLYSTYGEPMDIKIWLEKEGSILNDKEVLGTIDFNLELTGPDGRITNFIPFANGDGTFLRRIAPFDPGNYKMKIVAKGKTFEREKDFVFNIANVKESKEDVQAARDKKQLEKTKEQNEHEIKTQNPEEESSKISWGKAAIQFILIDLLLVVVWLCFIKTRLYMKNKRFRNIRDSNLMKQEERENTQEPMSEVTQNPGIEEEEIEKDQDEEVIKEAPALEVSAEEHKEQGKDEIPLDDDLDSESELEGSQSPELTTETAGQSGAQEIPLDDDSENEEKQDIHNNEQGINLEDILGAEAMQEKDNTQNLEPQVDQSRTSGQMSAPSSETMSEEEQAQLKEWEQMLGQEAKVIAGDETDQKDESKAPEQKGQPSETMSEEEQAQLKEWEQMLGQEAKVIAGDENNQKEKGTVSQEDAAMQIISEEALAEVMQLAEEENRREKEREEAERSSIAPEEIQEPEAKPELEVIDKSEEGNNIDKG